MLLTTRLIPIGNFDDLELPHKDAKISETTVICVECETKQAKAYCKYIYAPDDVKFETKLHHNNVSGEHTLILKDMSDDRHNIGYFVEFEMRGKAILIERPPAAKTEPEEFARSSHSCPRWGCNYGVMVKHPPGADIQVKVWHDKNEPVRSEFHRVDIVWWEDDRKTEKVRCSYNQRDLADDLIWIGTNLCGDGPTYCEGEAPSPVIEERSIERDSRAAYDLLRADLVRAHENLLKRLDVFYDLHIYIESGQYTERRTVNRLFDMLFAKIDDFRMKNIGFAITMHKQQIEGAFYDYREKIVARCEEQASKEKSSDGEH